MKKFLVVLLSLGLIVAFSTAASAVDVKFSGRYYLTGIYSQNPDLRDTDEYSRASFYTQMRIKTVFQIAKGLTFTTRFDAHEKRWGNVDFYGGMTAGMYQDKMNGRKQASPLTGSKPSAQENFEMEQGWVTFNTAAGVFEVGYQNADSWGTVFGDNACTRPRIKFSTKAGPVTLLAIYEKVFEADTETALGAYAGKTDADADAYMLAGIYKFKGGQAGLLYKYFYSGFNTLSTPASKMKIHALVPYLKATFGPVYVEGELAYSFGKYAEMQGSGQDIDQKGLSAYLKAQMKFGPAYAGLQAGYVQGDGDDATERTVGSDGGYIWGPALVLYSISNFTYMSGASIAPNPYKNDAKGLTIYSIFGGINPTPKLKLATAVTFFSFNTDKVWNSARTAQTVAIPDKKIGTEIDLTATYKIYDNLSYMVGGAYIIGGDAYQGTTNNKGFGVGNDLHLINKLTLLF